MRKTRIWTFRLTALAVVFVTAIAIWDCTGRAPERHVTEDDLLNDPVNAHDFTLLRGGDVVPLPPDVNEKLKAMRGPRHPEVPFIPPWDKNRVRT